MRSEAENLRDDSGIITMNHSIYYIRCSYNLFATLAIFKVRNQKHHWASSTKLWSSSTFQRKNLLYQRLYIWLYLCIQCIHILFFIVWYCFAFMMAHIIYLDTIYDSDVSALLLMIFLGHWFLIISLYYVYLHCLCLLIYIFVSFRGCESAGEILGVIINM